MSAQLSGNIDGYGISINMNVVADTLLANRPPQAVAGADQTITSTECPAIASLDGSASSDPDNNIQSIFWYEGNTQLGVGPAVQYRTRQAGAHILTLIVQDAYASESKDEMILNVNLPRNCH